MSEDIARDTIEVTAVVSDIHANLRALDVVLDYITREGIKRIVNLGDVIGYGPHPRECFEQVTTDERFVVNLLGNHDRNLLYLFKTPELDMAQGGMNRNAARALAWTRTQVYGEHPWDVPNVDTYKNKLLDQWLARVDFDAIALDDPLKDKGFFQKKSCPPEQLLSMKKQVLASFFRDDSAALTGYKQEIERFDLGRRFYPYFSAAKPSLAEGNALYAHDNILNPGDDKYTMDQAQQKLFRRDRNVVGLDKTCEAAAKQGAEFVFLGHLHHAKSYQYSPKLRARVKRVVNVGSVGFSRHDPKNRATFAVFAPAEKKPVQLIRLEYAWEKVADEMRDQGLPLPKMFEPS